jgi:hypothetical protein
VPGAPYLLASVIACWALLHCFELPPEPEAIVTIAKYKESSRVDGLNEEGTSRPLLATSLDSYEYEDDDDYSEAARRAKR